MWFTRICIFNNRSCMHSWNLHRVLFLHAHMIQVYFVLPKSFLSITGRPPEIARWNGSLILVMLVLVTMDSCFESILFNYCCSLPWTYINKFISLLCNPLTIQFIERLSLVIFRLLDQTQNRTGLNSWFHFIFPPSKAKPSYLFAKITNTLKMIRKGS